MRKIIQSLFLILVVTNDAKAQFIDYIVAKDNNLEIALKLRDKTGVFDIENAFWFFKNKTNQAIELKDLRIGLSKSGGKGVFSANTNLHGLFFAPTVKFKNISFGKNVKSVEIKGDETASAFAESLSSSLQNSNEGVGNLKITIKLTYEIEGKGYKLEEKEFQCKIEILGIKGISDSVLLSEIKRQIKQVDTENDDLFTKVYYQKKHIIDQIDKVDILNLIKKNNSSHFRSLLLDYVDKGDDKEKKELNDYFLSLIEKEDEQIFIDLYNYWDNNLLIPLFNAYAKSKEKFYCYGSLIQHLSKFDSLQIDSSRKVLMYEIIKEKEKIVFKDTKTKTDTLGRFKHWLLLIESTECPLWIPYLQKFLHDESKVIDLEINEVEIKCQGNGIVTSSGFINPEPQTVRELAIDQIFKLQKSSYSNEINKIRFELYKEDFRKENPRKPLPQDIEFRMHYGDKEFDKYLIPAKELLWKREMKRLQTSNQ